MGIQIPKVKKCHRVKVAETRNRQKGESPEDKLLPKHVPPPPSPDRLWPPSLPRQRSTLSGIYLTRGLSEHNDQEGLISTQKR